MLHEIVDYHYNNCTRQGLVLEKLKKEFYIFVSGVVIIVIAFMTSILYFSEVFFSFIPCILIFGISLFYLVHWFNNKAKKFVKSKYGYDTLKSNWGGKEFTDYMDKELTEYLKYHDLYDNDIMEELVYESIQFSEKVRYKSFWEKGFLAAAILPIWIKLIDFIFQDIKGIYEMLFMFFIMVFIVFLLASFYLYIKSCFTEIADSILNKTSKKYINFANNLRDIKFQKKIADRLISQ